jgi:succinate dehydrogenase / fumarate reductase, cytochrome b subunit
MADVNRGNRPLSPHLQIYRPQLNSAMSIFHRITGIGLAVTAILVVWWFLAAASSRAYFERIDGLLTSWIGGLILLVSLAALWYHFCNGIRHLWWDAGKGFEIDQIHKSGLAVLAASGVLTVLTLIAAF